MSALGGGYFGSEYFAGGPFVASAAATYAPVSAAHIAADLAAAGTTSGINTTGADLLVWVGGWFSGTPVPSDSKGNTWSLIANYNSAGNGNLSIWYAKSPTVGTGHTFTSGTNRSAIAVGGFSGSDPTAPYDTPNQAGFPNTFATTIQPGSVTPSTANCLVVCGLYFEVGTAPSIDSGFTIFDTQLPGNSAVSLAYKIQTTAAAVNPTWTCSTSQTRLAAESASFKPGAVVAVPYIPAPDPIFVQRRL